VPQCDGLARQMWPNSLRRRSRLVLVRCAILILKPSSEVFFRVSYFVSRRLIDSTMQLTGCLEDSSLK